MFAIIISEKGGAERKESFDKNEINVGRVQGNDLMLPKGNVSKHHARLLFRDGRFIVTDLKSTNGTYVNGRKIAQATIVREGDKIYIGDFVLRLDTGAPAQPEPEPGTAEEESIRTLARDQARPAPVPNPPAVTLKATTHPPNAPLPRPVPAGSPPPQQRSAPEASPPNYAPDRDPDDSEPLQGKPRQAPSAVPPAAIPVAPVAPPPRASTMPIQQMPAGMLPRSATLQPPAMQVAAAPFAAPAPAPAPPPAPLQPTLAQPSVGTIPPPQRPTHAPAAQAAQKERAAPRETAAQAGRRLALMTLLDRIADAVDLSPLRASPIVSDAFSQQLERTAHDQATAMREEGEAPEGIALDVLVRDAHRELVGLGPIGALLEDEEVSEIHCLRFDQVLATRGGVVVATDSAFTSEESLYRAIARLANQSGEPWRPGEITLERTLPRAHFVAVAPPASVGHVLYVRKRRRLDASLENLIRGGTISRPMAVFLEACLTSRANILICGAAAAGGQGLLAALAGASPAGERLSIVYDVEEINVPHAHVVSLALLDSAQPRSGGRGEEAVRTAAKLHPDRLIVTRLAAQAAVATLDAIVDGAEGVIASMPAPSLRQALSRLVTHLSVARPGLSIEAARDAVGEGFDVAVELVALADGRQRVTRIAELGGSDAKGVVLRDLFTFAIDPAAGDGTFSSTGVVPRLATDLAARGIKLDANIFKRAGR